MKAAELVESRRQGWRQLEQACLALETKERKKMDVRRRMEFASLYRAACADLALADSYQLPSSTVRYLHQLVGRAHNQLYRSSKFRYGLWTRTMFVDVPQRLFHDGYLRMAFVLFWGGFFLSAFLASKWTPLPEFTETVVTEDVMIQMESMYSEKLTGGRGASTDSLMMGFYIHHNTGIGLRCFAMGLLFGVGGLFAIVFNAVFLGAVFGHMSTVPQSDNFFEFVTAHGPFELTAIILSGAAGMRLGFSLVSTGGLRRLDSLALAARETLPIMMVAVVLFFLAAIIEGFISPSALPYEMKATVAMLSTMMLLFYLVVLGYSDPPDEDELLHPSRGELAATTPYDES